jgi:predicted transcriptional regulator
MARRRSPALTEGELRIMHVLWARGRATVGEVVDALDKANRPAYNTVLTMLRILERKGFATHEQAGRAYVYVPLIGREAARRRALSQLLNGFFDGSPELLVLNLLGRDEPDEDDLKRVRELIGQPGSTPAVPGGSSQ